MIAFLAEFLITELALYAATVPSISATLIHKD